MGATEWTTLSTAAVSVLGTLGGGLFAQRAAARDKRFEADRQDRLAQAERVAAANASALVAKRALYVDLNAAARAYRAACLDYVDSRTRSAPGQEDQPSGVVREARRTYLAALAHAHMTLPEFVLSVVSEVNGCVALGARLIAELGRADSPDAKTLADVRAWCDEGLSNAVWVLRGVLRWDLGVIADDVDDSPPRANVDELQAQRDDLRRLRREATAAFFPDSQVPPAGSGASSSESPVEAKGHGTIFGPWPPVRWHRGTTSN